MLTLSDPDFCRVVVVRYAWGFLRAMIPVAESRTSTSSIKDFLQSVAWQALVQDEGMLAREDGYEGFGVHREFATEFFGNKAFLKFNLLAGASLVGIDEPTKKFMSRLNIAAELVVATHIQSRGFWEAGGVRDVCRIYEAVCHRHKYNRAKRIESPFEFELKWGLEKIFETMTSILEEANNHSYNALFVTAEKHHRNAVDDVAELFCEALSALSNDFQGLRNGDWFFALEMYNAVFQRFGDVPIGLTPLQQVVILKLIKQLRECLRGYYPTISTVLIALVGPLRSNSPEKAGSAADILKRAVYAELRDFPALYLKDKSKAFERLPPNVRYRHRGRTLIHSYSSGTEASTHINNRQIRAIDLYDKKHWRMRES